MADGLLSSSSMALQYVEAQQQARPDLANLYADLADLYQHKLWHQLTLKLNQFLQIPAAQTGDTLIQLYNNFISDFVTKINPLKLAQFAVIASRQYPEKDAAITFLEGIITKLRETREVRINEPILHVKMQIAAIHLDNGKQEECKNLLEEGQTTLEGVTDVDPVVYASFYWISSQYHKATQEFSEFYKNALLYLAYTTLGSLSESFKLDLAFDLSLAALLGDNIDNFRELLAHPISKSLMGTKVEWIYQMLQAFNTGNLARYQELCTVHNAAFSAQPALVQNEQKLLEKFKCWPSEDRIIPLSNDAEQTKLSTSEVECLLMKRLSVKEEQTKDIRELISKHFKGMTDKQMQEMTEHFKEMTDPEAEDLRLKIKGLLIDTDVPGVPYNSQSHPYIIRFSMLQKLDTTLFHIQVARMRTLEAIQVLQEAANGPAPKQETISRALFILAEVGRGMHEDALDSYKRAVDEIPHIRKLLTNDFWPKDIKAVWDNQINQLAVKTRQSISDCRYSSFMVERILVVWEKPEELEVDFHEWQLNEHEEREAKARQDEMEQAKRLYTPKGIPTVLKAIEHAKELLEKVDNAVASVMLLSLNVQRQEHLMCQFISERYQQAGGTDLDVERGKAVQKRLTRLLF